jgi:hypothetical protein
MVLALPVAVGIALALVAGGDIRRLGGLGFRGIWLFYLAVGIQVLAFPFPFLPWRTSDGVARALWLASYGLLVAAALVNRRITGVPIIAAGMLSNVVAVVANGGHMPALPSALRAAHKSFHVHFNSAANASPHLAWLVDRWAVPHWVHVGNVFSVGDVLIAVGAVVLVWSAMGARLPGASRRSAPVEQGT